jgi:pyrimidine-nucleoside phosphorylase
MPTVEEASRLARLMVVIGRRAGRRMVALISDMNQPLGHAVGNALEVREAIDTLRGGGPDDFRQHCLHVAGHLLVLAGLASDLRIAKKQAAKAVADGSGLAKFQALVEAQGGDGRYVEEPDRLPRAGLVVTVPAPRSGYLSTIDAREVGETVVELGGGRAMKGDPIDHAVGVVVHHKVGDPVVKGEPLFSVHASDAAKCDVAVERVLQAHRISRAPVAPLPLFYRTIKG